MDLYTSFKDLGNEVRSYEYKLRRKGQCKAKIKLDLGDNVIAQLKEHKYPPSQVKVELTKVRAESKIMLRPQRSHHYASSLMS